MKSIFTRIPGANRVKDGEVWYQDSCIECSMKIELLISDGVDAPSNLMLFCNDCVVIFLILLFQVVDNTFPSNRYTIICKSSPFEPATTITSLWLIPNLTHPHVSAPVVFLLLHTFEHTGNSAFTLRSVFWTEFLSVPTVSNVDPFVASKWVRSNGLSRGNAMFPFLLHFSMHDKQGVVRKMDGDLA